MCGLVAIHSRKHRVDRGRMDAALDALAHRGPDGRGQFASQDGRTLLGHVRLAIVDLRNGKQPISSSDGNTTIIVNGEIYDSDRTLEALESRGHVLSSRSDSEIALHLYREVGDECVRLLRGELAFVVWDETRKRLFCARDRFGIKPLFYAMHEGELLIASEVKALFAAGLPAAWDDDGGFRALHMALPDDGTLYRGVKQLPPGHTLVMEDGELRIDRYWDLDFPSRLSTARRPSNAEAIHEVGGLLEDAVRVRLRADVPIACYLSGGVDSSAILGLAQRMSTAKIAAFTVAFEGEAYDESPVAREMAHAAGADFHVVPVPASAYADHFAEGVALAEIPPYNGHGPARYFLSRAVKAAGFKVALGGEGADEVFAGYEFLEAALRGGAGSGLARAFAFGRRLVSSNKGPFDEVAELSPLLAFVMRGAGFSGPLLSYLSEKVSALRGILHADFAARHRGRDPYRELLARLPWSRLGHAEPFRILLHLWMKTHFVNYVLAAERLDMAHGVELRLPFLDHRLFEYARNLPGSMLHEAGQNKILLRRTVAPIVTPAVRLGAKKPFFAPPTAAKRTSPLYTMAQDLVRGRAFGTIPFFRQDRVVALLDVLDAAPDEQRARLDPLYFFLAGLAVLAERYRLV